MTGLSLSNTSFLGMIGNSALSATPRYRQSFNSVRISIIQKGASLSLQSKFLHSRFEVHGKHYREAGNRRHSIQHMQSWTESTVEDTDVLRTEEQKLVEVETTPYPSVPVVGNIEHDKRTKNSMHQQPKKSTHKGAWFMWILGPLALLGPGAIPALWLPSPGLFAGTSTTGLLALAGLDGIFNLGATAFLLMSDLCARELTANLQATDSKRSTIPSRYKVWSFLVNFVGLLGPVLLIVGLWKGKLILDPPVNVVTLAAMLGPYTLLLLVQWIGESLVWQWRSPVWPILPLVYQAYRVLQLTRGLELGAFLSSPAWIVEAVKGLVAWWVFVLGMQIMWIAWLVGNMQQSST